MLSVIALLGSTLVCLVLVGSRKFSLHPLSSRDVISRLNTFMLLLGLTTLVTGTFLVFPKNYTFHTPWIVAAYFLISLYSLCIVLLMLLKKKRFVDAAEKKIPKVRQWLWRIAYFSLILILVVVVHDAVTKTTIW